MSMTIRTTTPDTTLGVPNDRTIEANISNASYYMMASFLSLSAYPEMQEDGGTLTSHQLSPAIEKLQRFINSDHKKQHFVSDTTQEGNFIDCGYDRERLVRLATTILNVFVEAKKHATDVQIF
jgi:hypothetical protein